METLTDKAWKRIAIRRPFKFVVDRKYLVSLEYGLVQLHYQTLLEQSKQKHSLAPLN